MGAASFTVFEVPTRTTHTHTHTRWHDTFTFTTPEARLAPAPSPRERPSRMSTRRGASERPVANRGRVMRGGGAGWAVVCAGPWF